MKTNPDVEAFYLFLETAPDVKAEALALQTKYPEQEKVIEAFLALASVHGFHFTAEDLLRHLFEKN